MTPTAIIWGLVGGVCLAAVALAINLLSDSINPKSGLRHPGTLIALFLIGSIGGVLANNFADQNGGTPPKADEPSPSPSSTMPTPSPSNSPTIKRPTPSNTTTSPPRPSPPSTQTYFLADVPYVQVEKEGRSGTCTGGCTGFHGDAARIGGNVFPNSWVTEIDGDGRRGTTTWNAVGACTTLHATVGLTDQSPDTEVTFTITTDGGTKTLTTSRVGEAKRVRANLTGVRTFTAAAFVSGDEVEDPDVAWGNLRMTCRSGSIQTEEE